MSAAQNAAKSSRDAGYEEILGNKSLAVFLKKLRKFDEAFCRAMTGHEDFTLRIEVRGNKGKLIHCRVYQEDIEQPEKE